MKVVFLEELPGTARVGEVRDVKDGFARNYLLPRNLAALATPEMLRRADSKARADERRQAALDSEARKVLERIGSAPIVVRARVGEQGRLYGSVTAADIAEQLAQRLGAEFDRRQIELVEPIRKVGEHQAPVRLTRNVQGTVQVNVEAEE